MNLLHALIASLGFNWLMFLPAYFFKTDKLTDLSYALTFAALALFSLLTTQINLPTIILTSMIVLWALRLGSYLFTRIRKIKKDSRFDEMRGNFWRFAGFWTLQGITVWVVLIPSFMLFENQPNELSSISLVGAVIWLIGLTIEAVADTQKYRFINNPKNKGKWIESGLWNYSRHPNYFGEILLWTGIYLYTFPTLTSTQALIGAVSPLYIAALISFISGIPLLEKSADKKWGKDKNYQTYKKRTNLLIIGPHKKS